MEVGETILTDTFNGHTIIYTQLWGDWNVISDLNFDTSEYLETKQS